MDLMVYGKIGRTGVYQMQDLLKIINKDSDETDYENKISKFKKIYPLLKQSNWFKMGEYLTGDHLESDNGIIDMLLHHIDRSYNVEELYDFIESLDLNIVTFDVFDRYKYHSEIGIKLSEKDKFKANELIYGDIIKHHFLVSKKKNTKADIKNLNNVVKFNFINREDFNELVTHYYKLSFIFPDPEIRYTNTYVNTEGKRTKNTYSFMLKTNYHTMLILKEIDGKKTIGEIIENVNKQTKTEKNKLIKQFEDLYKKFQMYDLFVLENN